MSVKGFATLNKLLGKKKDKSQQKSVTNKIINSSQLQQENCIAQLPVATSTTPFEQTFRITVLLPRDQLYVTRLGAKVKLEKLLDLVCEDKLLDCELYEFRHPIDTSQVFNMESTIGAVGLTELRLCNKSETYDNFNADEIIKMRHQTVERDSLSSSEFSAKKTHTLKTASPYSSTNSLNSMDSTGMNTNYRAPIKIPIQNNGKQQPPIPPARKKRKAPLPPIPSKIYENSVVTDTLENNNNNIDVNGRFNGFKKPMNKQDFYMSTPNISNGTALQFRDFNHSNMSINSNDAGLINGRKTSTNRDKLRPLSIQYDSMVMDENEQKINGNSESPRDYDKIDSPIYAEVTPRKKSAPLPPPRIITRPVASPRTISTLQLNESNDISAENHTSVTQLNSPNHVECVMNIATPPSQFKDSPIPNDFKSNEIKINLDNHVKTSSATTTLHINGFIDSESSTDEISILPTDSIKTISETQILKSNDLVEHINSKPSAPLHALEVEQKNYNGDSTIINCNVVTEKNILNTTISAQRPVSPEPILIPAPDNFADINFNAEIKIQQELEKSENESLNIKKISEQKAEQKNDEQIIEQITEINPNLNTSDNLTESEISLTVLETKKTIHNSLPVMEHDNITKKNINGNIEVKLTENIQIEETENCLNINKSNEEEICDFSLQKSDSSEKSLNTNSKTFITTNLIQNLNNIPEIESDNRRLQSPTKMSNLSNFKISTYRPLSVTVKTFPEENDTAPNPNTEEDKIYVKKLSMITLQKDSLKKKSNISRSDSFHSTRYINDYTENKLRSRSSSVYSLLGNQNSPFQEFSKLNGKSSSQLSISESPSLQSLIVMKSILNSRKNSINNQDEPPKPNKNDTTEEKKFSFSYNNDTLSENKNISNGFSSENSSEQDEPTKKWKYQGPPSINLSTWSERPKVQPVAIKNEGDYIIGGKQSPLNISTSIIKKDYRKSMPPAIFAYQDNNNNSDNKFSSIQYAQVNGNPVPGFINKTNNGNVYKPFTTISAEQNKKPILTNSIQKEIIKNESKDSWKLDSTKSLDRSKLKPKLNRHSLYEGFDNRLNKKIDEQIVPAFAQITLRKTGLKEKIVANSSTPNGASDIQLNDNNCRLKLKSNENTKFEIKVKTENLKSSAPLQCHGKTIELQKEKIAQPPPPPPPIIRSVVTKQNSANLTIDPRDQLLSAIRNFNLNSLKQS